MGVSNRFLTENVWINIWQLGFPKFYCEKKSIRPRLMFQENSFTISKNVPGFSSQKPAKKTGQVIFVCNQSPSFDIIVAFCSNNVFGVKFAHLYFNGEQSLCIHFLYKQMILLKQFLFQMNGIIYQEFTY